MVCVGLRSTVCVLGGGSSVIYALRGKVLKTVQRTELNALALPQYKIHVL